MIQNSELSPVLQTFVGFLHELRLSLLFLVSGVGVCFALRHRSRAQFFRDRAVWLVVPFLFGVLVIVPPMTFSKNASTGCSINNHVRRRDSANSVVTAVGRSRAVDPCEFRAPYRTCCPVGASVLSRAGAIASVRRRCRRGARRIGISAARHGATCGVWRNQSRVDGIDRQSRNRTRSAHPRELRKPGRHRHGDIARLCAIAALGGELDVSATCRMPSPTSFHWGGCGGSAGVMDPATKFSFGYATNHHVEWLDARGVRVRQAFGRGNHPTLRKQL